MERREIEAGIKGFYDRNGLVGLDFFLKVCYTNIKVHFLVGTQ
jgi:hypothetical protein